MNEEQQARSQAASILGRLGGKARAMATTKEQRAEWGLKGALKQKEMRQKENPS